MSFTMLLHDDPELGIVPVEDRALDAAAMQDMQARLPALLAETRKRQRSAFKNTLSKLKRQQPWAVMARIEPPQGADLNAWGDLFAHRVGLADKQDQPTGDKAILITSSVFATDPQKACKIILKHITRLHKYHQRGDLHFLVAPAR